MNSFELQEELQALQDLSTYEIQNEHDISSMDPRSISQVLETAVEAVADSSDSITDPAVFDAYRSLLKHAENLQGSLMNKMLDSISSAFQAQVDATIRDVEQEEQQIFMAHKMPLEMYAFLLNWFVVAAEKAKAADDDDGAPVAAAPKPRRGRGGKAGTSRATTRKNVESWTWMDQIPGTLALVSKVLRLKTQRIWLTTAERDTFIK